MTVLDLLDELEDIMDTASNVPLTGKVMVDKEEVMELVNDIRRSLPDDMKQAKWLKDEQNRILDDAKSEYKKLIVEAKKQADFRHHTEGEEAGGTHHPGSGGLLQRTEDAYV